MVDAKNTGELYHDQFIYQSSHAVGKVLNVGCNNDGAGLGSRGVNMDLFPVDPFTKIPNVVHILADARYLPFPVQSFNSVVLGEILEHMEEHDAISSMHEAIRVLRDSGRVVITLPHDNRGSTSTNLYAPGIHAHHYRCIARDELFGWINTAGLMIQEWSEIEYVWGCTGTGLVAQPFLN